MFERIRVRAVGIIMLAIASFSLASCDSLAAMSGPTQRYVIQADLEQLEAAGENTGTDGLMQSSMDVISRRLRGLGIDVHSITSAGEGRIMLEVSGQESDDEIATMFGTAGKLAFRMIDMNALPQDTMEGLAPPGSEILPMADGSFPPQAVRRLGGISGRSILNAKASIDALTNEPTILIELDKGETAQLAELTLAHVDQPMAIVLDDVIISAPIITEPILEGTLQLNGGFTVESANRLATMLRSGALPIPFVVLEVDSIE